MSFSDSRWSGDVTRSYSDIVTYDSPSRGCILRVRLKCPIITPDGKPGYDAEIINEAGEPDIATYFFTGVWLNEDQIINQEAILEVFIWDENSQPFYDEAVRLNLEVKVLIPETQTMSAQVQVSGTDASVKQFTHWFYNEEKV